MRAISLFSGIGGFERAAAEAGAIDFVANSEIEPAACSVLAKQFASVPNLGDVRSITKLPDADIVTAGFPCQDLSQAGTGLGLSGARSGLVYEIFRLLDGSNIATVIFENVPFMLRLGGGSAMREITSNLERLGYQWAYRTIDARAFGLPQRRRRVILVASKDRRPEEYLLRESVGVVEPIGQVGENSIGFYWTEGNRGVGWAVDAIPTLKCGSSFGIASAPAVVLRDLRVVTPTIEGAELLQGFPEGWSEAAPYKARWRLVGNAVSVPVARWVLEAMFPDAPTPHRNVAGVEFDGMCSWPAAAYGGPDRSPLRSQASEYPSVTEAQSLEQLLKGRSKPLSLRATQGFVSRLIKGPLSFRKNSAFTSALGAHIAEMTMFTNESREERNEKKR